ncbi:zinc-dependent peptidase [Flavisolibacter tropicus]|uniref:M90 family metallopeptidase n=1 Tax=Flavisolibacter tropicus TaxID=1492898 RepID=UPI00082A64BD|nr:M90 family metallopeptidase [Flavisolibacter tropicus]
MEVVIIALVVLASFFLVMKLLFTKKHTEEVAYTYSLAEEERGYLIEYVPFYNELDEAGKQEFESRLQHFLNTTRISGVNVTVEPLDRVLVAASAIIPIFGFKDWEYINLNEVLLYPDAFNDTFDQQGADRSTLGVVGNGPYQNIMILSQYDLRQGFLNKSGKSNTAIHEFVHLVDKTDGAVDGVPEALLSRKYVMPWLELVHENIERIQQNNSDINPYGATNKAEFLAVVAEYFFERPDLLQERHPDLYELLAKMFRQEPAHTLSTPPAPNGKGSAAEARQNFEQGTRSEE